MNLSIAKGHWQRLQGALLAGWGKVTGDHLRIVALAESALDIAEDTLAQGGAFLAKVLQGGTDKDLLARLKQGFAQVKHVKPKASRADSAEVYVLATGYRGGAARP